MHVWLVHLSALHLSAFECIAINFLISNTCILNAHKLNMLSNACIPKDIKSYNKMHASQMRSKCAIQKDSFAFNVEHATIYYALLIKKKKLTKPISYILCLKIGIPYNKTYLPVLKTKIESHFCHKL